MKWGIVTKPNVKKAANLAQDIMDFLQEKDEEVLIELACAKILEMKGHSLKDIDKNADIVITIGGDGTILHTLAYVQKPIFAINSGGMGFLAEVESKYAIGGVTRVLDGNYNTEERAKLKITVDRKRLPDAANEVTVQTSKIAKILYLQLFVDNELIETMGADGVIVSTPTGSTSYALSVGGPLLDPAVQAMVIAPIAPFKLSARPWIVPLDKTIGIKILPKSKSSQLVIDGRTTETVTPDSDIIVTKSERTAKFIRFGESFYQMVRLKLVR
jgi:NAD+ kinase